MLPQGATDGADIRRNYKQHIRDWDREVGQALKEYHGQRQDVREYSQNLRVAVLPALPQEAMMDATPESLKTSPVPPTFSDAQPGGKGESEREEIRDSEMQPQ